MLSSGGDPVEHRPAQSTQVTLSCVPHIQELWRRRSGGWDGEQSSLTEGWTNKKVKQMNIYRFKGRMTFKEMVQCINPFKKHIKKVQTSKSLEVYLWVDIDQIVSHKELKQHEADGQWVRHPVSQSLVL